MRILQLGIDYGTSATKVVVRDGEAPGGSRAWPIAWGGVGDPYRLPSAVALHGDQAWFGLDPSGPTTPGGAPHEAVWCTSLKMRVAAQVAGAPERVRAYAAKLTDVGLPCRFSFNQLLLTGLVWTLRVAKRKSLAMLGAGAHDTRFLATFGLPTDFRHDPVLSAHFLALFRAAYRLAKDEVACRRLFPDEGHRVTLSDTLRSHLDEALSSAREAAPEDVDYWHQSEARASTLWAWNSSAFGEGAYLHVDIGAGTTNVAAYLVAADFAGTCWVPSRIAVFSAESGTVGVDAFRTTTVGPRGRNCDATRRELLERLLRPYRHVWQAVRTKTGGGGAAWAQWYGARVVPLGGGATRDDLVDRFAFHPFRTADLDVAHLSTPPSDLAIDLGRGGHRLVSSAAQAARRTLAVAYGLTLASGLPEERCPSEISDLASPTASGRWRDLAGIYEK